VDTGEELRTVMGRHDQGVQSVAFSPDGHSILSGGYDNTLKLWDIVTGKELRTFTGHPNAVFSVAFSPDGRTALSGSFGRRPSLWDVATGKELSLFAAQAKISYAYSVAIAPNGRTALVALTYVDPDDPAIKLFDLATGKELNSFTGHTSTILSVAFSPDGRTALSGSIDTTLKLWDLTPYLVPTFAGR
jgi:WD40 repeat protein